MNVFIIIPAWNEEASIVRVIRGLKDSGYHDIVVVDDGSSDRTYDLAKAEGTVVLRHLINRGQGASLKTGTEYALRHGADIIVHFDADGQMRVQDIDVVIEPLVQGEADFVSGSRYLSAENKIPWLKRWFLHGPAKIFEHLILGVKFNDPQCGFRAFSREAHKKLDWQLDGMAHNTEIRMLVGENKLRYKEVPIVVIYKEFGVSFGGGLKILKDLFFKKIL